MSEPSATELEELLGSTKFSRREIMAYYKYGDAVARIHRKAFDSLARDVGFDTDLIITRLWGAFDTDANGSISVRELIVTLHTLTRGTLEELSAVFFRMYDINGDAALDVDEITEVYSALYGSWRSDGANQLSEKQRERIRRFVTRADGDGDGTLDPSEFAAAVRALAQEGDASAGGVCDAVSPA